MINGASHARGLADWPPIFGTSVRLYIKTCLQGPTPTKTGESMPQMNRKVLHSMNLAGPIACIEDLGLRLDDVVK